MSLLEGLGGILSIGGWGFVILPFTDGFDSRYAGHAFLAAFVTVSIGNIILELS